MEDIDIKPYNSSLIYTFDTEGTTSKEIEISGYDNITSGEQTITVTYRGQQTSFKITVKDEVEKITIKSNPTKTVYKKGEKIVLYYYDKKPEIPETPETPAENENNNTTTPSTDTPSSSQVTGTNQITGQQ